MANKQRLKEQCKFIKRYLNPDFDVDDAVEKFMNLDRHCGLEVEVELDNIIKHELEYNRIQHENKYYGIEKDPREAYVL